MRLFIAEKSSVAKAIASEQGQTAKGDGFIQCGTDTGTWCFGHTLEQAEPDDYTPDDVPRNGSGKKVWRVDEILEHFRCNKPARRFRVSARDSVSVKRGLCRPQGQRHLLRLGGAARARQRADWLIGMNLSRAYILRAQHKPVPYHTIRAEIQHAGGTFLASWRGKEDQAGIDSEGRLVATAMANALVATVTGRPGTVAEYKQVAKKPKLKGRPDYSAVRETSEEQ
jgi:DNA topoisomerase III